MQGIEDLAVHIDLQLVDRGVADPHRRRSLIAGEPGQRALVQSPLAGHGQRAPTATTAAAADASGIDPVVAEGTGASGADPAIATVVSFLLLAQAFFTFARKFPAHAKKLLVGEVAKRVKDPAQVAAHFTPTYNPWDQRLCLVPDADLFRALASGTDIGRDFA